MKRLIAVLSCVLVCVCCLFACSCTGGNSKTVFAFLSVRMKGNGDGTVTAVAQNEFALTSCVIPVTLTVYASQTYQTDTANMTQIQSVSSERLKAFARLEIETEVIQESYFCASMCYEVGGEKRYIQSETLLYGTDGNRIK